MRPHSVHPKPRRPKLKKGRLKRRHPPVRAAREARPSAADLPQPGGAEPELQGAAEAGPTEAGPAEAEAAPPAPAESSVGSPSTPDAPAPVRKCRLKRMAAAAAFTAVLLAALGFALWWRIAFSPMTVRAEAAAGESIDVMVEQGDTLRGIALRMNEAGFEVSDWELRLAARFGIREAAHRLHAGLYRFPVESTPLEAVRILAGRPIIDQQVRIPDGATLSEVMSILAGATNLKPVAAGMEPQELKAALGLEGYPSIEGFVAPDTYRYGSGTSDLAVLKRAVERQKKILEDAWAKRTEGASELKSPYEALILASIVEKETGERSDRRLVSSVFNNRLKVGMPLQSDPTVIYGLGPTWSGRLAKRDLQAYTPYNTYRIEGLPPTPISSATPASIEAAVAPAETRYLYFVSRGDGTSEFTTNLRDHNRAVEHFILKRRKAPFKPISPDRPSTAPLRAR